MNDINKFKAAIIKVAEATGQTKTEVIDKMVAKDSWTWFLVEQAEQA